MKWSLSYLSNTARKHSRSHTCSTDGPRGDDGKPLRRASERQSSRCATAGAARAAGGRADPTAGITLAPGSGEAGCQNAEGSGQHWGGPHPGWLTKAVSQARTLAAGLPAIPAGGGDPRARAGSITPRLHWPWRACPEASSVPSTKACPSGGPALQDGGPRLVRTAPLQ